MDKLPKLKKKLSAYILGEDGKIPKQALLAMGAFLGSGVLSSLLMSQGANAQTSVVHSTNTLTVYYDSGNGYATATHTHHASHASY